jgi:DNA repair protein RecN (Recombination protein N)
MSRFLLALKACFSHADPAGTLVFDEIDVGVSGRVAQAIAEKLHQLSRRHQVLCVTHQPLVAAMADCHFRVDKNTTIEQLSTQSKIERTVVRVTALDNLTTRREELATLAGGKSVNEAIAFAESLLAQAADRRQERQNKAKSKSK